MADSSGDFPRGKSGAQGDGSRESDDGTLVDPLLKGQGQPEDVEAEESKHKVTSLRSDRIGHTLDTRTLSAEDAQLLRTITAGDRSLLGGPSTTAPQLLATLDLSEKDKLPAAEARVTETVEAAEKDVPPATEPRVTETVNLAEKDVPPAAAPQITETVGLPDTGKPPTADPRVAATLDGSPEDAPASPDARVTDTVQLPDTGEPPATDPRVAATLDEPVEGAPASPDARVSETVQLPDTGKPPVTDPQLAATYDGPSSSDAQIMETADLSDKSGPPTSDPRLAATFDGPSSSGAQIMETADLADKGKRPTADARIAATLDKVGGAASIHQTIGRSVDSDTATERGSQGGAAKTWHQLVIQPRQLVTGDEVGATDGADYEVDRMLGKGAMGVVFAARQTSISRSVAVKMLKAKRADDKKQRDQFLAEAVVTGDLDHPNIVPIYDLAKTQDGALFYSMKHVKGTPWDKAIGERTVGENLAVWLDVGDAMAFAHDRGVVHRDLKPENIMLGDYGEVLVMDWGMAVSRDMLRDPRIRDSSGLGGTPAYMAPEMAVEAPLHLIKASADVYLMGSMLYEIVSGTPPHRGRDVLTCVLAAARNEIVPSDVTGELMDIAMKAMATKPEDRYASVKDVQAAVRVYLSHTESNKMVARAEESMERARETLNYNDYQQSIAAYREALTIWEENQQAQAGLETVSVACAQRTLQTGDLDLGLSVLDSEKPEHAPLIRKLNFKRRIRQGVRLFIFVLLATIVGGGAYSYFQIQKQVQVALENEGNAKTAQANAVKQADEATKQQGLAQKAAENATKSAEDATKANALAQQRSIEATKNAAAAQKSAKEAEAASYRSKIALAASQIDANVFDRAKAELDEIYVTWQGKDILRTTPWELARLQYMLGLSEHTITAGYPIHCVAFSSDGQFFAAGGEDPMVKIWRLEDGGPVPHREITTTQQEVTALAFLDNGDQRQLVTVSNGQGQQDQQAIFPTDITIWDVTTGAEIRTVDISASDAEQKRWIVSIDAVGNQDALKLLITSMDKGSWQSTGTLDRAVQILADGSDPVSLTVHGKTAWDATISGQDGTVVAGDEAGNVMVWQKGDNGTYEVEFKAEDGSTEVKENNLRDSRQDEQGFVPHSDLPVYAVQFSPDGQQLATAGGDRRVLLWTVAELLDVGDDSGNVGTSNSALAPTKILMGHQQAIRSINYSFDGKRLVSGSDDGAMRVWDLTVRGQYPQPIVELRGHSDSVRSCVFSPVDPDIVVSGSLDGQIRIWNVREYREFLTLQETEWQEVYGAAFSPDGESAVAAQGTLSYGAATVWGLRTTEKKIAPDEKDPTALQEGHVMPISHAIPSRDANRNELLTIGLDGRVRIWDETTGRQLCRLAGVSASPNYTAPLVAASADGRWILAATSGADKDAASSGENGVAASGDELFAAHVWDRTQFENAVDPKPLQTLGGHAMYKRHREDTPDEEKVANFVTSVAVSKNGTFLFTGDSEGKGILWKWDATKSQFVESYRLPNLKYGGEAEISTSCFTPDESRLLCAVEHRVHQFNVQTGEEFKDGRLNHTGFVKSMDMSGDGARLVVSSSTYGLVTLWDVRQPVAQRTGEFAMKRPEEEIAPQLGKVSISPDGSAALAVLPTEIRLIDLDGGGQESLRLPTENVRSATFYSDDASQIVTVLGGMVGVRATLWDVSKDAPEEVKSFGPSGIALSARFSSKGNRVVTAHNDGAAQVWNVETGQVQLRLSDHHTGAVRCAVFSPDDRLIYTAGDDGKVNEWDADTGHFLHQLCEHAGTGAINDLAFSTDGRYVVTASKDKTARIWDLDSRNSSGSIEEAKLILEGHTGAVLCAEFSGDGRWIITGGEETGVEETGAEATNVQATNVQATNVQATGAETSGAEVTGAEETDAEAAGAEGTATKNQPVRIWDTETGTQFAMFGEGNGNVAAVGFSSDGRRAVIGCANGTAHVWAIRYEAAGAGDTVVPQGPAGLDETVGLTEPAGPHGAVAPEASAAPDEIADASDATSPNETDGTDETNGADETEEIVAIKVDQVLTLREHDREVTAVMFSPNDRNVLTASRDGRTIVWPSTIIKGEGSEPAPVSVLDGG